MSPDPKLAAAAGLDGFDPAARHPSLVPLLAQGTPSGDVIERFLATCTTPLVEPGAATFLWYGEADRVALIRWIHASVGQEPFERIPGTALWLLRIAVEDGGRFEYKLVIGRAHDEEWVLDPRNPARASDPFGENSVCRTWGYQRPEWTKPRGAPAGHIEPLAVESRMFGEIRNERVYLPASYSPTTPHPLVVIHDGEDFMTYADLSVSLDNLIAAGDIPPLVAALLQTNDRLGEYSTGRRHARYLVGELLPAITARYAIDDRSTKRILLGASLGAVASLATAFRYPGVFCGLVLKSGSFILDRRKLEHRPDPVFHRIERLVQVVRRAPNLPRVRAFVSTGEFEGLADDNRALASFLRDRGADVMFQSAWDGHHWHNWRDQLRDGLMWVLRRNNKST